MTQLWDRIYTHAYSIVRTPVSELLDYNLNDTLRVNASASLRSYVDDRVTARVWQGVVDLYDLEFSMKGW